MQKTFTLLVLMLSLSISILESQSTCPYSTGSGEFHANLIRTQFQSAGDKFWNREDARFQVPFNGQESPSTFFASNTWLAAMDDVGNLHVSAGTYYRETRNDFGAGPLVSNSGQPIGVLDEEVCANFDRVWSVTRNDILAHISDYDDNGVIDAPIGQVFGWPAEGNTFFETYNGFDLPDHQGGWADFNDINENGIYEPDLGEHPQVTLQGIPQIPDQILWLVFNDLAGQKNASFGEPLTAEIQLTAFAFYCDDNPLLNLTLFNSYKVINQSPRPYKEFYYGHWADVDLGCFTDDFIGTDPERNTVFAYNTDPIDGTIDSTCNSGVLTYASNPPAQTVTFLNQDLAYSGYYYNPIVSAPPAMYDPSVPIEYYRFMTGRWRDGTPWTVGGNGYNPGSTVETNYMFPDEPLDDGGWSMYNANLIQGDRRLISSAGMMDFPPGGVFTLDVMYAFHQSGDLNNVETTNLMYQNLDELLAWVEDPNLSCTQITNFCSEDCVWPGDFNADGKVDHVDYLALGVANRSQGPSRNGLTNWIGHQSDDWSLSFPSNENYKHTDANGDGEANQTDLFLNALYFDRTRPFNQPSETFVEGDDLLVEARLDSADLLTRSSHFIEVNVASDYDGIYGLAFEIDYDTSLFRFNRLAASNVVEGDSSFLFEAESSNAKYAAVLMNQENSIMKAEETAFLAVLLIKSGIEDEDLPESTTVRLKNLIGIDASGAEIDLGYRELVIPKDFTVTTKVLTLEDVGVTLFPNPSNDRLNIQQGEMRFDQAEIFSLDGKRLKAKIFTPDQNQQIDLSAMQNGLYVLRLISTEVQVSTRIMIQHP